MSLRARIFARRRGGAWMIVLAAMLTAGGAGLAILACSGALTSLGL